MLQYAGASSQPYNQMQDSPPYVPPYPNGMPPGGPSGDRPAGFPPGQHQMPPQGFIPPEASGAMPNYMVGGFRPPGMPPHLRLPPPGPLPGALQNKRPGQILSWSLWQLHIIKGSCIASIWLLWSLTHLLVQALFMHALELFTESYQHNTLFCQLADTICHRNQ